jgi:hypothetical protein
MRKHKKQKEKFREFRWLFGQACQDKVHQLFLDKGKADDEGTYLY